MKSKKPSKKPPVTNYEHVKASFGCECISVTQIKVGKWRAPEIEIPSVPNERTIRAARRFANDILAACEYAEANDRRKS